MIAMDGENVGLAGEKICNSGATFFSMLIY